jgi:hypothetical protein
VGVILPVEAVREVVVGVRFSGFAAKRVPGGTRDTHAVGVFQGIGE